ncbi:MAG: hypothetical protein K2M91_01570, partial [Lachnospiraceae bacterium]|nr:hypothetical protein [Lachnospiraceae bacterium]
MRCIKPWHGCGLKYGETKEGTVLAFEIDGYRNDYIYCFKNYPNPYSVDVTESYDTLETHRIPNYLKQEYDYYDEDFEYRLGGGLRSYTLKGLIENGDGSLKQDEIYKVLFDYREQGTLWKKEYWYNEDLFNTY